MFLSYLPELLRGILPTNSFEYLCAAGMFIHESAHLVYIVIDNDVEAFVDGVVFADVFGREFLRHCGGGTEVFVLEKKLLDQANGVCRLMISFNER